jgi:hypothetical protein
MCDFIVLYFSPIYVSLLANYIDLSSVGQVLRSRFNLAVSLLRDRRSCKARICILATKGKTMGFNHID